MQIEKERRRPVWLIVLLGVLALLLLGAGALFVFNKWKLELTLNGESSLTLEYGEEYQEQGATAFGQGTIFSRDGETLEPTVSGSVDTQKLGTYELTYAADYKDLHREEIRTVTVIDTRAPEITLKTVPGSYTLPGHDYEEEGYTATDNYDGDLTAQVTVFAKDGEVTYTVKDSSGNETTATRSIFYDDPVPPELTLEGEQSLSIQAGTSFSEPGYTATDNCDGDLTETVSCTGSVDIYRAGDYTLTYEVSDKAGNSTTAERTVTVRPIAQPSGGSSASGKVVYLTFDDGPSAYTAQLLQVLEKYNVKATFFVVNYGHADMIGKEAAAGHTVGVHTATHDYNKIYASEEAYFADFTAMQDIIFQQTGLRPTILRFPGGSSNRVSSFNPGIMTTLTQAVQDMGMQYFDWNVSSGDAGETTDTEVVFQNVIDGIQKHDVSVVLQHDSKPYSVDAVEKIIVWGLANGYTFLPLTQGSYAAHHHLNN